MIYAAILFTTIVLCCIALIRDEKKTAEETNIKSWQDYSGYGDKLRIYQWMKETSLSELRRRDAALFGWETNVAGEPI